MVLIVEQFEGRPVKSRIGVFPEIFSMTDNGSKNTASRSKPLHCHCSYPVPLTKKLSCPEYLFTYKDYILVSVITGLSIFPLAQSGATIIVRVLNIKVRCLLILQV